MNSPRDEIGSWLDADVQPLPPPPGTFERVSRRARRRKVSRAILAGAGAAVIVTGLAVSPKIASALLNRPAGQGQSSVAAGSTSQAITRPPEPHNNGTPAAKSASHQPGAPASLSGTGSGDPVPGNFRPTSVTFVGPTIGAVIGQAGTPGDCAGGPYCTSLAGTADYGKSWFGVSAPATGAPNGSSGVSQLRFLNTDQGFAFGPELWTTANGGAQWSRTPLPAGVRVTDLETLDGQVFALWARCAGRGPDFASNCTSFSLHTAQVGGPWRRVGGAVSLTAGGTATSASLILVGGTAPVPADATGYVLAPDRRVLSGKLSDSAWTTAGTAPCAPGAARPDGQPSGGLLAAGSGELFLLCTDATTGTQASPQSAGSQVLYASADGGKTWQRLPAVPDLGTPASLAAGAGGLVVVATSEGIEVSRDGGASWRVTLPAAQGPAGGFSYVGMTNTSHGVAVPAHSGLDEIWFSTNGGRSWQPSPVAGDG